MAIKIDIVEIKYKKKSSAVRCDGQLSNELGEALVEMYPGLLELGTPLNQVTQLLWDKKC